MAKGTIIARGKVPLRKTPKMGAVRKKLRRNARVEILGKETWLRVRTRDGAEGYVLADHVETAPADLFPPRVPEAAVARAVPVDVASPAIPPRATALCDIRVYRNTRFIGNELRADVDFFPCLDRLNAFAAQCVVEIFVTSSTREPGRRVDGAIVRPATRSNHLVGHAIDMNLKSVSGLFNSTQLKNANLDNLPREIGAFLALVRHDKTLRWGGDFTPEDPVHFDDGLNLRDPGLWDAKLASRG
jgi:hypothetical protein